MGADPLGQGSLGQAHRTPHTVGRGAGPVGATMTAPGITLGPAGPVVTASPQRRVQGVSARDRRRLIDMAT